MSDYAELRALRPRFARRLAGVTSDVQRVVTAVLATCPFLTHDRGG